MPAYNFKAQFAGDVKRGDKTSTIRKAGVRPPPRVGDTLRLYTGMRTKQCRLLRDVVCESCIGIRLTETHTVLGGRIISDSEENNIAARDGFRNAAQLRDFFRDTHGLPFEGWLITWRNQ